MDVNMINPVLLSFKEILPRIGFQSVEKQKISLLNSTFAYKGIILNVTMVGKIKGIILIGMDIENAKKFASKMMKGLEIVEFDALAQSAISEMGNMVCANTCTQFAKIDVQGLDISPPTLMMSTGISYVTLPVPQIIAIDFLCEGDILVKIYVGFG
jgi:chemotaxis protein CheX